MGLGPCYCPNCMVFADFEEHLYNYNDGGWFCPACKTSKLSHTGFNADLLKLIEQNEKFFKFLKIIKENKDASTGR